jgi:hypothetical protein
MACVHQWSGKGKTGWLLYKRLSGLYHPHFYATEESASKQIGWFGDEVHKVRITRIDKAIKPRRKRR